jgi:hypothetical protein
MIDVGSRIAARGSRFAVRGHGSRIAIRGSGFACEIRDS